MATNDSETLNVYRAQLEQVEAALSTVEDNNERSNLLSLKSDLEQLIDLTKNEDTSIPSSSSHETPDLNSEYDLFMSEMSKCGAVSEEVNDYKHLEGKKIRAPYLHKWGDLVYHNALLCSILPPESGSELRAKILFTQPTHEEMRPCPYFFDESCKFSDDKCRYSHGEVLLYSKLEEFVEPDFENLKAGSLVLAKGEDELWHRARVKKILDENCVIRFDSDKNEYEKKFCDVYPLDVNAECSSDDDDDDSSDTNNEELINISLLTTPTDKLGAWEQYTKGIGTKLLEKMGYVVGTGLGKRSDGRIEPVPAFICPAGKSLDYCFNLQEESNGTRNLITFERKLEQNRQKEIRKSENAYHRSKKKVDVFTYLNDTILRKPDNANASPGKHKDEIKKETSNNLNIESLKLEKHITVVNKDLQGLICRMEVAKGKDKLLYEGLRKQFLLKESELTQLKTRVKNIKDEKLKRKDLKKLTIF